MRYYVGLFPKRSTITGVYYTNLLDQLRTAIRKKRRGRHSKGVLLQQDNTRVHTCKVAMEAVERNGYELIPHPVCSPDLATSDFGKDPDFFNSGMMAFGHRWSKSIILEGNCTEKEEADLKRK